MGKSKSFYYSDLEREQAQVLRLAQERMFKELDKAESIHELKEIIKQLIVRMK